MPVPRSAALAVVAVLLMAAGCVQTPPGPLPQATPSWSCTPVAGGTPYPCYEHDYQEAAAQNKLYEQAETVYRKYHAENERIYRAGGADSPTAVLQETTTGEYLQSAMDDYRDQKASGERLTSGQVAISWVKRLPNTLEAGSVATLKVCTDVSNDVWTSRRASRRTGVDMVETLHFVQDSELLKIASATHEWVKSC